MTSQISLIKQKHRFYSVFALCDVQNIRAAGQPLTLFLFCAGGMGGGVLNLKKVEGLAVRDTDLGCFWKCAGDWGGRREECWCFLTNKSYGDYFSGLRV